MNCDRNHRWQLRAGRRRQMRRGTVLVVALVCLLVMMAILGGMLLGSTRARRQLHPERDLRQTELLLAAGSQRAAYRLAIQPDYRGETWRLPAESIVGDGAGEVTISATHSTADAPWQVHVVAEYPHGSTLPIHRSRTFLVSNPSTQTLEQ